MYKRRKIRSTNNRLTNVSLARAKRIANEVKLASRNGVESGNKVLGKKRSHFNNQKCSGRDSILTEGDLPNDLANSNAAVCKRMKRNGLTAACPSKEAD